MPTRRDPGMNMINPGPVDYLLPGETTVNNPPRAYGKNYGVYGGVSNNYSGGGNRYSVGAVPAYTPPVVGDTPVYASPGVTAPPPAYAVNFREMPTYSAPAWNESEIDTLAQKRAAPGLRQLRQQVQRVTGRRYDNPQVGRMTLRDALQGYGSGVSQVVGQAGATAAGEYGQKYARTSENARASYASEVAKADAYNRYSTDVAKTNYQGSFAQWQAENQRLTDESKMRYGGEMAKWGAENASNERMADRDYEGALAKWKAETEIGARESAAESAYQKQQRGFDDAWERWKKQQKEMPTLAGGVVSWNPSKPLRGGV